ncbi:MAG TPA: glycosyltransferase family 2 protein [Candidatus Saccharimonadales bacterium]
MAKSSDLLLSVVVPLLNEGAGLPAFHKALLDSVISIAPHAYEIIYCDDGSTDGTDKLVKQWHGHNPRIKLIKLSRNFGKENALSAGIGAARGQAVMMVDGDGQHPVELIAEFVSAWRDGAQVVVGVRTGKNKGSQLKRSTSMAFYKVFNKLTGQKLLPGSTDFRLIDRAVQQAFLTLQESDRITRGLIDWLGFRRQLIYFEANARRDGAPGYSQAQLMRLAANSFVSLTPKPLYLFGYLGVFITMGALLLGLSVLVEQLILGDPWHWKFTGTAMLGILTLFLVGIILLSQGILSLYISHIHSQSKGRPLYVIDYSGSAGIDKESPEDADS